MPQSFCLWKNSSTRLPYLQCATKVSKSPEPVKVLLLRQAVPEEKSWTVTSSPTSLVLVFLQSASNKSDAAPAFGMPIAVKVKNFRWRDELLSLLKRSLATILDASKIGYVSVYISLPRSRRNSPKFVSDTSSFPAHTLPACNPHIPYSREVRCVHPQKAPTFRGRRAH